MTAAAASGDAGMPRNALGGAAGRRGAPIQ